MELFVGTSGITMTVEEFKELSDKELLEEIIFTCLSLGGEIYMPDNDDIDEELMQEIEDQIGNILEGKFKTSSPADYKNSKKKPKNPEDDKVKEFDAFLRRKKQQEGEQ